MTKKSALGKIMKLFGLLMIAALILSACQTATEAPAGSSATEAPAASSEPIQIPFSGPLTGPDGVDGQGAAKAGELAVNLANKAGGVCGGRQLIYKTYDTKADPKEGANIATLLSTDKSVYAVVADYNSAVFMAAKPIYNEAHISAISYYTTRPGITLDGPYSYRIYPPGENMAKFFVDVFNRRGYKRIAQVYENEDYGQLLSGLTAEEAAKVGIEIVASEPVLKDQTDVSAVVSKIKASNPDAIMAWVQYSVGSFFVKQAADLGLTAPLYGHDGLLAPEFITLAGELAEGVRTNGSYSVESTDPEVVKFVTAFREAYGTDPNNPAGYVWDATNLIIRALEGSNCASREAVKEWLDANVVGKTFKGVTGTIAMDENRDRVFAPGMYVLLMIKDGKYVPDPEQ